ncbi:MAG: hypothetical protein ACE5D1_07205 [Fidelibacterota bacterium]
MLSHLPVQLEDAPELARFLGVEEVCLVREDRLPDGGGKKRRSLIPLIETLPPGQPVHVLSYDGSHTAYTLARLLPENPIILYAKAYPGGKYRRFMAARLAESPNVTVIHGSLLSLLARFWIRQRRLSRDRFLSFGGALARDREYSEAAAQAKNTLGDRYHHIVPVASGNLLAALRSRFSQVTGVLTQPWYVRGWIHLKYRGLTAGTLSIKAREGLVKAIADQTGLAFDPVFMGAVLAHVRRKASRYRRICLWVTSPALAADFLATLR